jgi:hypothetical protein
MIELDTEVVYVPRRGQTLHLVRWLHRAGGWTPETIAGVFVRFSSDHWVVDLAGKRVELLRTECAPFDP